MIDDAYSATGIIAAIVVLQVAAVALVAIRFWSRRYKKNSLGADDWLILAATVVVTGFAIIEIIGCAVGAIGSNPQWAHQDAGGAGDFFFVPQRLQLVIFDMALIAQGLIKLSAVLLCRRIFQTRTFQHVATVWGLVIVIWAIAFLIATLAHCAQQAAIGNAAILFCPDTTQLDLAYSISDTITDLFTLMLPMPMIYKLNMQTRTKIVVGCFFLIGLVPIGASVGKLAVYVESIEGVNIDFPQIFTAVSFWNVIECQVGIITACLPTVRPFFSHLRERETIGRVFSRFGWSRSGNTRTRPSMGGTVGDGKPFMTSNNALIRRDSTPSDSEGLVQPQDVEMVSFDKPRTIAIRKSESRLDAFASKETAQSHGKYRTPGFD